MTINETIQKQLDQCYVSIAQKKENCIKIRNWSISIRLAYFALMGSGHLHINFVPSVFLTVITLLIFLINKGFSKAKC